MITEFTMIQWNLVGTGNRSKVHLRPEGFRDTLCGMWVRRSATETIDYPDGQDICKKCLLAKEAIERRQDEN